MRLLLLVLNLLLLNISNSASAAENVTRIDTPERLVAIGDIHGDAEALKTILRGLNLIDANENWIGGKTVVISMGDHVDKGFNSRQVMDLMIKLEQTAAKDGGRVISLLGNHELRLAKRDLLYFSRYDALNYLDFAKSPDDSFKQIISNALTPEGPYAQWLASRPTMLMVGKILFVHAGLEHWASFSTPEQVNLYVGNWMKFYLGMGERPSLDTAWTVAPGGPLRTRLLSKSKIDPEDCARWLTEMDADHIVVGHTVTKTFLPQFKTVAYGDKLIMIDTGISRTMGGMPTAVEWSAQGGYVPKMHVFARSGPIQKFQYEHGVDYLQPKRQMNFRNHKFWLRSDSKK